MLATGAKRLLELGSSNGYSHADEVADLRTLVTADRRTEEALAPTGAGLLLVTRLRQPPAG